MKRIKKTKKLASREELMSAIDELFSHNHLEGFIRYQLKIGNGGLLRKNGFLKHLKKLPSRLIN